MQKVLTFGRYLKNKYKTKVYKIPLSISGFTCPNINGSLSVGGCTFCENESFSPNLLKKGKPKFSLNPNMGENPILQSQLEELRLQYNTTKKLLQQKYKAKKFIVYFQSFSNTYAPYETLKALYTTALSFDDVIGISVGTRCDCVNEDILKLLKSFDTKYEVWIEYGIQSVFNETLQKINRAETIENIEKTIKLTKDIGLNICGHIIFGLPNETKDMMVESVKKAVSMGINSIKIHPLYVVKNTALAVDIQKGRFSTISQETYLQSLLEAIKLLPQNVSVQRVSAGINSDSLISPIWCKRKDNQMKAIRNFFAKHSIVY